LISHAAPHSPKRVERLHAKPWKLRARASRALRRHLDAQARAAPHFKWSEFACHDSQKTRVRMFASGCIGNETSGPLHVDARGRRAPLSGGSPRSSGIVP
jgi:hypothetical protein